jgi:hypothetical protein
MAPRVRGNLAYQERRGMVFTLAAAGLRAGHYVRQERENHEHDKGDDE